MDQRKQPTTEAEFEERSRQRQRATLVTAFSLALVASGKAPAGVVTAAERIADDLLQRHPQAML